MKLTIYGGLLVDGCWQGVAGISPVGMVNSSVTPIKRKGTRNFLAKSSFWPKYLFLLKETKFCLFGFSLAETESLLQISVVKRNFDRNLVPSEI